MNFITEWLLYYSVRILGFLIRLLPVETALAVGKAMGFLIYTFDIKHRRVVTDNLKIAFAQSKAPQEIKEIAKQVFQNYGQNFIELLRLPVVGLDQFEKYVKVEGREHVQQALAKGNGVILLAMHFGSWELANLATGTMGSPYKVIVNPQKRFSRLDDLLNSYRACGGAITIERGMGTREFINSLKNNEIIGMVVDQGGRDGLLIPFLGRQASMAVGAIRVGLKWDVPVCFAIIVREKGPYHRLIIHEPFALQKTDDAKKDLYVNLEKVVATMEPYVRQHPSEYMWFYKIWKYSKESVIAILEDGRTGHLRQSQAVAKVIKDALQESGVSSTICNIPIVFKNSFARSFFIFLDMVIPRGLLQGHLGIMQWFLTKESFHQLMSWKIDFVVSCGAATAAVNDLFSNSLGAKSVVIQKPGVLNFNRFDLVILPKHDVPKVQKWSSPVAVTMGAPNLITEEYLKEHAEVLLKKFSHLKVRDRFTIGLFIGGDTKGEILAEQQVKKLVHQIKEAAEEIDLEILITTSRRTSARVENILLRDLKKYPRCGLLILANRNNIPEAVGGILNLADMVLVSGDSISMVSEAVSSGKTTIVFNFQDDDRGNMVQSKHQRFLNMLQQEGYILLTPVSDIKAVIYQAIKSKITLRKMENQAVILEAIRKII